MQNYQPKYEAISKEIELLQKNFSSEIFEMNFRNPLSYCKLLKLPFLPRGISHIYTSLGDRPYLSLIKKPPIILTGSASATKEKIRARVKLYKKLERVVVESERQREILLSLGVDDDKVKIILPGINLENFSYTKEQEFRILFASSPPKIEKFESRGVNLMLDYLEGNKNPNFLFLWRKTGYDLLKKEIGSRKVEKQVDVINELIADMNEIFGKVSCTIAPFLYHDDHKPVPRSILESLAAGKPVLVSNKVSVSSLVKKEACGVVFEPTLEGLKKAIDELQRNYESYQKNSRKTAEKYFSAERFVEGYKKIYEEVMG